MKKLFLLVVILLACSTIFPQEKYVKTTFDTLNFQNDGIDLLYSGYIRNKDSSKSLRVYLASVNNLNYDSVKSLVIPAGKFINISRYPISRVYMRNTGADSLQVNFFFTTSGQIETGYLLPEEYWNFNKPFYDRSFIWSSDKYF